VPGTLVNRIAFCNQVQCSSFEFSEIKNFMNIGKKKKKKITTPIKTTNTHLPSQHTFTQPSNIKPVFLNKNTHPTTQKYRSKKKKKKKKLLTLTINHTPTKHKPQPPTYFLTTKQPKQTPPTFRTFQSHSETKQQPPPLFLFIPHQVQHTTPQNPQTLQQHLKKYFLNIPHNK
jgi:hypothetical protein